MDYTIIWILFGAACIFLFGFYGKKLRQLKKVQQEQRAQYEEKRERFKVLTSEMFDEVPDQELTHTVLFHIMGKEDKIYEGDEITEELIDVLTHGEKLIYTICQVENSLEGGRGSIHSFFIKEPYCTYRPYYKEAFEAVNCHELAKVMEAAEHLTILIENDQEDEIDDDSDYATYNFTDFTNEIMALLKSSGLIEKAGQYIREHKEEFIDKESLK